MALDGDSTVADRMNSGKGSYFRQRMVQPGPGCQGHARVVAVRPRGQRPAKHSPTETPTSERPLASAAVTTETIAAPLAARSPSGAMIREAGSCTALSTSTQHVFDGSAGGILRFVAAARVGKP